MQAKFFNRGRPLSLGIHVLAGAVGVLAGLQHLLSATARTKHASDSESRESVRPAKGAESTAQRRDYFSIRRTKSELGYVYWVLQGHGNFQCFVLLDTWKEAVDEACRRASEGCPSSLQHADIPVPA